MAGIVGLILYVVYILWEPKMLKAAAKNASFKDKRVLVTGGSSGIGRALALEFNRLGATVIIAARNM